MESAKGSLIEYLTGKGVSDAADLVEMLSDEQAADMLASYAADEAERVALRERVMADETLRRVATPDTTWGTADTRYEVSKTAIAIIENTAAKYGVTVEALLAGFVANGDSLRKTIEMFGDPRFDRCGQHTYYAWRCRVRDALAVAKKDETEAAREAARLARYSKIEGMGLEVCTRCDGNGGYKHWPDFTCYQCGGIGGVEPHDH